MDDSIMSLCIPPVTVACLKLYLTPPKNSCQDICWGFQFGEEITNTTSQATVDMCARRKPLIILA